MDTSIWNFLSPIKNGLAYFILYVAATSQIYSQEFSAGINVDSPNPNAVLHLVSPHSDQGLLIPKLKTSHRAAMELELGHEDVGIMVFDADLVAFFFWNGNIWIRISNTDHQNLEDVLENGASAGNNQISDLLDPTAMQDAATKSYVDSKPTVTDGTTIVGGEIGVPISVNVGIGANQIVRLDQNGRLPAVDGSALIGVVTAIDENVITNREVASDAISSENIIDGTITDNDVSELSVGKITGLGTAATVNVGTAVGDLVQVTEENKLPALDGSALTGIVTAIDENVITNREVAPDAISSENIVDGTIIDNDVSELSVGKITGLGTAATLNVGTAVSDLVQLTEENKLPALDGSALIGIVAAIDENVVTSRELAPDAISSEHIVDGTITDNDVSELSVGKITGLGTAATLNVGTAVGDLVQLTEENKLPALDGSALTGIVTAIDENVITNRELGSDAISSENIIDGTITDNDVFELSVTKITGLGTAATLNVGTVVGDLVQLTEENKLPALDGSALIGIVAAIDENVVTSRELAPDAISSENIAAGSINGTDIEVPLLLQGNTTTAVLSSTQIHAIGRAALFQSTNASSANPTLEVLSNGNSVVGRFVQENTTNSSAALFAATDGPGAAAQLDGGELGLALNAAGDVEITGDLDINGHITSTTSLLTASNASNSISPDTRVVLVNGASGIGPGELGTIENGRTGREVILISKSNSLTVYHQEEPNGNIILNGSADFVMTLNSTLTLVYDGAFWLEVSRAKP